VPAGGRVVDMNCSRTLTDNPRLEALGCGTPIVSSGTLVPPRDPSALITAMDQIDTLRERFPAEMLRQRAADFSDAACTSRYLVMSKACRRTAHGRPDINSKRPFGLQLATDSAHDIAASALHQRPDDGVALVVTPNIDHIAMIRRLPALAHAYRNAARIVCDGWPVRLYARFCGIPVARVTGCEIISELMRMAPYSPHQRIFFVVDSATTERAVLFWAAHNDVTCETTIPPFGFERDPAFCTGLATSIAAFGTTVLIMAVGAPRSEVFVDTYRRSLPTCWAFCVGQAVKIELGLVRRASLKWQLVGMEWLWRLLHEPSRLAKRYARAALGFGFAVIEDQFRRPYAERS
jgi:N-acetylglucosaminyldiphosphoundecaprenol N-acetyl-beta-D-mannosaminyltransferase